MSDAARGKRFPVRGPAALAGGMDSTRLSFRPGAPASPATSYAAFGVRGKLRLNEALVAPLPLAGEEGATDA
jgi:hypothetical protein